ncbi:hypothetical protein ISF_07577 [Cordyceps fumosorosea ARSEF 2679]|uniref:Uncharacterized protein n=1 Tax=Cordyceps fumosorosea (strain ARSEF 2679) TaxID=1081104 RepID=A0A167NV46_CORFA|nr:hypothetical protein ISF_07577 [Cordyceps fumosorosea ARSEF 2679]OAA55979.1 hypothetical protein ISF_07577 [Cordyceps fumosorosea ARSEF 2679]
MSFALGQKRCVGSLENAEVRSARRHNPAPDGKVLNHIINSPTLNLGAPQSSDMHLALGVSLQEADADADQPDYTLCPADLDLETQNMQSYDMVWGPLGSAGSSDQQAEPDLFDFGLCPADLDLETQNMQSYDMAWGSGG